MMQLCYGCRHVFPPSLLLPCVLSDIISHRFDEVQKTVDDIKTTTEEEKHHILKLKTALRELYSAVYQEIGSLKECKANLEAARQRDRQERELGVHSRLGNVQESNTMSTAQQPAHNTSRVCSTGIIPRATFNGTVPTHKLRKMNSALELVSATIYTVLESLAIRARAAVALLWLPPPAVVSTELVAPFVVGRDMSKLRNSAPYRLSEVSIPCVVRETGIAVNIKPKHGPTDLKITENTPLMELLDAPNVAQLLVPIFTRYGEVQRNVLGVLHIIGNPVFLSPFTLQNEEMSVQTAATLSIILSSYQETMGGEWANRIYDSSLLTSASAYQGALDMRSSEKCVDDIASPPTFIYRFTNERNEDDEARDAMRTLRIAAKKRAVPRKTVWFVKDLKKFAVNMEKNWILALKKNAEIETKLSILEDKVIRNELEKGQFKTGSLQGTISQLTNNENSNSMKQCSSSTFSAAMLPPVITGKTVVLKTEEVDKIEISALQRLQSMGVDTAHFVMTNTSDEV